MGLKETWVDKIDGVDINSADDVNQIAHAVIELEDKKATFYITATEGMGGFSLDKTFSDVSSAYNEGYSIICIVKSADYPEMVLNLSRVFSSSFVFEGNFSSGLGNYMVYCTMTENYFTMNMKKVALDSDIQFQIQSDLSQNDAVASDYVKNRTHYVDADGTVHKLDNKFIDAEWMATMVAEGEEEEILPERTISFTSKVAMVAGDSYKLLEGSRYTVYWNGTAYACTAALASSGDMVLGNGYYHMTTMQNTGEPFCFTESGGRGYVKKSTATAETFTVRIVKLPDLVPNKLPAEFLPDGIGGNANIDVTAEVGQTIVVKAVDENGKPTAWESADYQERTHWTESGVDVILDGQTVTFGSDGMGAISGTLDIEAGKTYTVIWDGAEYICDCMTGYYSGAAVVYLGNPVFLGLDNNGFPFVIGKVLANGYTMAACLQPNTTHSVGILSATVNKIPERYMGDNEFVVHFEGDPTIKDGLTMRETAEEIITAIESGKKFKGEVYGIVSGGEMRAYMNDYTVRTMAGGGESIYYLHMSTYSNFGTLIDFLISMVKTADGTYNLSGLDTHVYEFKTSYSHDTSSTT